MSLGGSAHTRQPEKVAYGTKALVDIKDLSMYYLDVEQMNAFILAKMVAYYLPVSKKVSKWN